MSARFFSPAVLLIFCCLSSLCGKIFAQNAQQQPVTNVVCVLLDEMSEAQIKAAPGLAHLQRSGMLFTNAAVMPADMPTRSALLTGLNPSRLGLTFAGSPLAGANSELSEPIAPNNALQQQQNSLVKLLSRAGYSCVLWNIYRQKPTCLLSEDLFSLSLSSVLAEQNAKPQPDDKLLQILQKTANDKQGLLLFVDIRLGTASTAAANDVLDALKKQLAAKNRHQSTLVILLGAKAYQPAEEKNKLLHSPYQGNISANLLVGWLQPDAKNALQTRLPIKAASSEGNLVSVLDVMPTILACCGVANPQLVDGYDLRPYLMGRIGIHRPQSQFMHYPHAGAHGFYTMLRQGEWKLVYRWDSGRYELYNLVDDPRESKNLAERQPRRLSQMAAMLQDNCTYFNARPPLDKQSGTPLNIELPAEAP